MAGAVALFGAGAARPWEVVPVTPTQAPPGSRFANEEPRA
jgi:hypothetical protein